MNADNNLFGKKLRLKLTVWSPVKRGSINHMLSFCCSLKMFGPSASSLVIIYVFGLVPTYIDSYLMQLLADHSPVPSKSRDPMKTVINYCTLHYFWKLLSIYECKIGRCLQHKCLPKLVIIFGTFENEKVNSTVIAFGIVEGGGLTGP